MQRTPSKTGEQIDEVIDRLNAKWDLQIERLSGNEAERAGEEADLGRKCASRIRALCWRGNVNIEGVIEDFEERAARRCSDWIYKPSQARGTLLSLPQSKSFLKNAAMTRVKYTTQGRLQALKLLADLLEEEFNLSRESDSYSRTSTSAPTSRNTSFAETLNQSFHSSRSGLETSYTSALEKRNAASIDSFDDMPKSEPFKATQSSVAKKRGVHHSAQSPLKREKTELDAETAREREARQLTLSQLERRRSDRLSSHRKNDSPSKEFHDLASKKDVTLPLDQSHTTTASDFPDVFSDPEGQEPSSDSTSLMSDLDVGAESQFSGGTQLDQEFSKNSDLQRSFDEASSFTKSLKGQLDNLATEGPFRPVAPQWSGQLDYWFQVELYRLSLHLNDEVGRIYYEVTQSCGKRPTPARLWKQTRDMCQERNLSLPQRSTVPEWASVQNQYADETALHTAFFSGKLEFASESSGRLFDFQINPMGVEKGCRFHRRFGADRFFVLDIPSFSPKYPPHLPPKLKHAFTPEQVHEKIWDWLADSDLHIAGRIWRAFYVESKYVSKKKRAQGGARQKVHLFAIGGLDFKAKNTPTRSESRYPVSLLDFTDWHMLLEANEDSSDLKLFARMRLGLTKTIPTVVLEPHEFIEVDDIQSPAADGAIMTDGCGRMSMSLAVAVWKQISDQGGRPPSAFQARIGGVKGLWIIEYDKTHPDVSERNFWIEIRPSQVKIQPHPARREDAEVSQRTFEVVNHSTKCNPANLNAQLITILEHNGVSRTTMKDLLLAELTEYNESLNQKISDPCQLQGWRATWHPSRSSKAEMSWSGNMPDSTEDELDLLLESGFLPASNRYLIKECLYNIISQGLETRKEKLWIREPQSTNVFCVPDPYGVLEEDEIQINFSTAVSDAPDWDLHGKDALVARNPAHLKSDIQKIKLVERPELLHLQDVVIFSVKGDFPLAGKLSGGDYDGDTVTLLWNQKFTEPFRNCPLQSLPSKADCGLKNEAWKVRDHFAGVESTQAGLHNFMRKCLTVNASSSRLGEVTKLLERLIYKDSAHLMRPAALKLAALAGYLVDATKGGDFLPTHTWKQFRNTIQRDFNLHRLPEELPYDDKEATDSRHRHWQTNDYLNVLDFLKFGVATGSGQLILENFAKNHIPEARKDKDLSKAFDDAWRGATEAKRSGNEDPKTQLNALKAAINNITAKYAETARRLIDLQSVQNPPKPTSRASPPMTSDYSTLISEYCEQISEIEPLDLPTEIRQDFERDGGGRGTRWSTIRASCVYSEHPYGRVAWKLVGDELCHIKAVARWREGTRVRPMMQKSRDIMKVDSKKLGRLAGTTAAANAGGTGGLGDGDDDDENV